MGGQRVGGDETDATRALLARVVHPSAICVCSLVHSHPCSATHTPPQAALPRNRPHTARSEIFNGASNDFNQVTMSDILLSYGLGM